ncbi:MAG: sigma-54-dependent Fis family transcriptional regulator [Acidobacteria bacterium]|nr:sigma-54-dependent Fis family transcriptional regulator [Acidobacteriota bacterium]
MIDLSAIGAPPGLDAACFQGRTFEALSATLAKAAAAGAPCLIWGENGVGKNFYAWLYHRLGPRRDGPYEEISCAALPETLLETELFGYARGAYTGAEKDHPGRLVLADGGTLVLDELDSLAPASQAKLLRVVETGEFTPLGSDRKARVDARFIGLLQAPPEALVTDSRLRRDLFYRMSLFTLEVPPLRRRRDEIPTLVETFARREAAAYRVEPVRVSPEALEGLAELPFPGNLRELRNLVRRWTLLQPGEVVTPRDLPSAGAGPAETAIQSLAEVESGHIRRVLAAVGGRMSEAARLLGIHRKTLLEKRKRYKLD